MCAYWGLSFVLLDISKIHKYHSALNYSMHFTLLGTFIVLRYSGIVKLSKDMEKTRTGFAAGALGPQDKTFKQAKQD
jgi:hypothetical protein